MIEVNERIDVPSSSREVWKVLSDPHAVVECVPGASLGELQEDGYYDAGLLVKFGPAKITFNARFMLELDEPALSGAVTSRGKDNQGGTRIHATMNFRVVDQEGGAGSSILIDSNVEVSGRLSSVVESGASLVVGRMTREFTERLVARLAAGSAG
ncbi:MAG: carbon monoxide dehydrogenase [Betaproteobacteria bacterium]|nr:MAG: carbon monoxide dehydrogenase [Betaproteobacteria bacterium]